MLRMLAVSPVDFDYLGSNDGNLILYLNLFFILWELNKVLTKKDKFVPIHENLKLKYL